MLACVIEYMRGCSIPAMKKIEQGLLQESADAVCVRSVGGESLLQRYIDGSSLRQFVFSVCMREQALFGKMTGETFLEKLAVFLEDNFELQKKLILPNGCYAQKIEVLETAAITDHTFGSQRYEMKCRLIYYREEG